MNVDGKILKLERDALWELIFFHDLNNATYFDKKEDAYECNEEGRYSTLKKLNKLYKIKGKYEFLIEYPELNKSNQWRQALNPLRQSKDQQESNATGYEPIDVQMNEMCWGGLFRSDSSRSLLDGSRNGWWHYAIGTSSNEFNPYFPGPDNLRKIVKLWVRMPTSLNKNSCIRKMQNHRFGLLFYIFLLNTV